MTARQETRHDRCQDWWPGRWSGPSSTTNITSWPAASTASTKSACELPSLSTPVMATRIDRVLHWVDETLAPHMAWEETSLYGTIDDRAETRWATQLIRFDHRQIRQQASRLRTHRPGLQHGPSADTIVEVRCDLFGLEALLRANLEREETFLLPLLEREAEEWTSEWRD